MRALTSAAQACVLQDCVFVNDGHAVHEQVAGTCARVSGNGSHTTRRRTVTERVCFCVPPPHGAEQSPKAPNEPTLQLKSTGCVGDEKKRSAKTTYETQPLEQLCEPVSTGQAAPPLADISHRQMSVKHKKSVGCPKTCCCCDRA